MEDNSVYVYDETNPLEQSYRNILHYQTQPQDSITYLVQFGDILPDGTNGTTPPHLRQTPTPRLRNTTIVNTYQLPETVEEERDPLECYIRKNLPIFRKSLVPDEFQHVSHTKPSEKGDNEEGVIVMPINTQEGQRQSMTNEQRNEEKQSNVNSNYHNSETMIQSRNDNKFKDRQDKGIQVVNEITVMADFAEPVSVVQQTPFNTNKLALNRFPSSRVKVMLMVDSVHDEIDTTSKDKKYRNTKVKQKVQNTNNNSIRSIGEVNNKYKLSSSLTQQMKKDNSTLSKIENEHFKYFHKYNFDKNLMSEVKLSPYDCSKPLKPFIVKSAARKSRKPDSINSKKNKCPLTEELVIYDEKPVYENSTKKKFSITSINQREQGKIQIDNLAKASKMKKQTKKPRKGKYIEESQPHKKESVKILDDVHTGKKYFILKAPRSATKMITKKQYHIQIPEHGRAETWFNVQFNIDDKNNVNMNYEGPVKISHYYSSKKYTK